MPLVERLSEVERRLAEARQLLFCLDFDGTLAPLVDDPDAASMTRRNRAALESLADHQCVAVAVVSGRSIADLRARVDVDGIAYAGNHGLELDHGDGAATHPAASAYRPAVQTVCDALETRFEDVPGCAVENKGVTATVHVRNAESVRPESIASDVAEIADDVAGDRVRLTTGKDVVEVRPDVDWHKGHAVRTLEARFENCLSVYVGDDTTDEDAFRAIAPDGIGIRVGDDASTEATYCVPDTDGVATFLEWLLDAGLDRLESDVRESGRDDG